ncbi:unnamed protein product [Cylicocyclus nassatus]|uniref:Uncharacterized protein n=1 Tax=Cylicocyclus nassatus TaxID=53992 RepID=A0AA36GPJ2_CYLNA|nr:unnamed protein product [Cylicocyclus nassatus]
MEGSSSQQQESSASLLGSLDSISIGEGSFDADYSNDSVRTTSPDYNSTTMLDADRMDQHTNEQTVSVANSKRQGERPYSFLSKAERKAYKRSTETQTERDKRLSTDAKKKRMRKSVETEDERGMRLARDRARKRRLPLAFENPNETTVSLQSADMMSFLHQSEDSGILGQEVIARNLSPQRGSMEVEVEAALGSSTPAFVFTPLQETNNEILRGMETILADVSWNNVDPQPNHIFEEHGEDGLQSLHAHAGPSITQDNTEQGESSQFLSLSPTRIPSVVQVREVVVFPLLK